MHKRCRETCFLFCSTSHCRNVLCTAGSTVPWAKASHSGICNTIWFPLHRLLLYSCAPSSLASFPSVVAIYKIFLIKFTEMIKPSAMLGAQLAVDATQPVQSFPVKNAVGYEAQRQAIEKQVKANSKAASLGVSKGRSHFSATHMQTLAQTWQTQTCKQRATWNLQTSHKKWSMDPCDLRCPDLQPLSKMCSMH